MTRRSRTSRWSIAPVAVAPRRPKSRSSSSNSFEDRGRRLKSPPNTSGVSPGPADGGPGGSTKLAFRVLLSPGAGVEIGHADLLPTVRAGAQPGEDHPPALRQAALAQRAQQHRSSAGRHDAPWRSREDHVRSSLPGAEQVRPPACDWTRDPCELVPRRERLDHFGTAAATKLRCPGGRCLLEQADRPLGGSDHFGELLFERLVDLQVGAVVERRPRQPPRRTLYRRVGRRVATVKDVPGENRKLSNLDVARSSLDERPRGTS